MGPPPFGKVAPNRQEGSFPTSESARALHLRNGGKIKTLERWLADVLGGRRRHGGGEPAKPGEEARHSRRPNPACRIRVCPWRGRSRRHTTNKYASRGTFGKRQSIDGMACAVRPQQVYVGSRGLSIFGGGGGSWRPGCLELLPTIFFFTRMAAAAAFFSQCLPVAPFWCVLIACF